MSHIDYEDWQIAEISRCLASPAYFVESFCWLEQKASAGVSESSGIIPFELGEVPPTNEQIKNRDVPKESHFYFQREILTDLREKKNVLTLKSRRVGCSWIAAAYVAWLVNFHKGVYVILISRKETYAKKILAKVLFILRNLAYHDDPSLSKATKAPWLCNHIVNESSQFLSVGWRDEYGKITSFSTVESVTTTDDSARGDDATFMVFDELAFYEHPDETWGSSVKTLARGGHWMAISTPHGIGNIFHRLCAKGDLAQIGSLKEELTYEYHKIHWSEAGITQEMVDRTSEGDSQDLKDQEWEWKFITPGSVVFNPTNLAACYKPPSEYPEIAEYLEEYHQQVLAGEKMYFGGVDTIKGNVSKRSSEKDYNSITFFTDAGIQAYHEYNQDPISKWAGSNYDTGDGGRVEVPGTVSRRHEEFPGDLMIEEDGPGLTVVTNHILPKDKRCRKIAVSMREELKYGLVERMSIKIDNQEITITDEFTYQCLMVYQRGSRIGSFAAPEGYYDDPVISALLSLEAMDQRRELKVKWGNKLASGSPGQYRQDPSIPMRRAPQVSYTTPREYMRDVDQIGLPDIPIGNLVNDQILKQSYKRLMDGNNGNMRPSGLSKRSKLGK